MKIQLDIQEHLKDLRVEKGMTLKQLSQQIKFLLPRLVLIDLMIIKKYLTGISWTWRYM